MTIADRRWCQNSWCCHCCCCEVLFWLWFVVVASVDVCVTVTTYRASRHGCLRRGRRERDGTRTHNTSANITNPVVLNTKSDVRCAAASAVVMSKWAV